MHVLPEIPRTRSETARLWLTRLLIFLFVFGGAFAIAKLVSRSARHVGDHVAYYTAAQSLIAGGSAYDHPKERLSYLYPPPFAYVAKPLGLLPPRVFGLFWGSMLGAGWLLSMAATRRLLGSEGRKIHWVVDVVPSLLLFRAGYSAWALGNVTLLLSPMILLALLLDRHGRVIAPAALLAVAGMLKIFPLFVAGALFLRPGRRRGLVWLGIFMTLLAILPAAFVGIDGCVSEWRDGFLHRAGSELGTQHQWSVRCAPLPTYWRVLGLPMDGTLKAAELGWSVVCLLVLLALAKPAREKDHEVLWYAGVVATLLMVTPIISKNYLILLLFPCAAAIQHALERPEGDRARLYLLAGVGISAFFLNVYNPWIVGSSLSRWMDRFQPAENCLLVFWLGLMASLVVICREKKSLSAD